MLCYTSKFKYIILLSAIKLIENHSAEFIKGFRLELFNKTNDELENKLTTELYKIEKNYKFLNVSK